MPLLVAHHQSEEMELATFEILKADLLEDDFMDSFLERELRNCPSPSSSDSTMTVPPHPTMSNKHAAAVDQEIEDFRGGRGSGSGKLMIGFQDLTKFLDPSGRAVDGSELSSGESSRSLTKATKDAQAKIPHPPLTRKLPTDVPGALGYQQPVAGANAKQQATTRSLCSPATSSSSAIIVTPIATKKEMVQIAAPAVTGRRPGATNKKPAVQEALSAPEKASKATSSIAGPTPMTESGLKTFAETAITSFIQNVRKAAPSGAAAVDTSTKRIQDLIGDNWMEAIPTLSSHEEKKDGLKEDSPLTAVQRLGRKRERNKESARVLRLRKKAHVEELERALEALVSEKAQAELESHQQVQRQDGLRHVRFHVLQEFLKLRGRSERNKVRWSAILEEKFTLRRPAAFVCCSSPLGMTLVSGIDATMNDEDLLLSTAKRISKNDSALPALAIGYRCNRQTLTMDGPSVALAWEVTTSALDDDVRLQGSLLSEFNPATNKLVSVTLYFDKGALVNRRRART